MRKQLTVIFSTLVASLTFAQQAPNAVQGVNPFKRTVALQPASAIATPGPSASIPKLPRVLNNQERVNPEKKSRPEPSIVEESVQGVRIGRVGDLYVYRGAGTYLYQSMADIKVVQKLAKPEGTALAAAAGAYTPPMARMALPPNGIGSVPAPAFAGAGMPPPLTMGLPSSVGRPTPSAATAIAAPSWGSGTSNAITATTVVKAPASASSSASKPANNSNNW